ATISCNSNVDMFGSVAGVHPNSKPISGAFCRILCTLKPRKMHQQQSNITINLPSVALAS
ncbi:MAG: hypothetical protein ACK5LK_08560, partial [Chthoniobacterales bacterium]